DGERGVRLPGDLRLVVRRNGQGRLVHHLACRVAAASVVVGGVGEGRIDRVRGRAQRGDGEGGLLLAAHGREGDGAADVGRPVEEVDSTRGRPAARGHGRGERHRLAVGRAAVRGGQGGGRGE